MSKEKMIVHHGHIDVQPEKVGYNAEKLEVLDQHFIELIESDEIQAASYLLARGGKVFAKRSMGKLREDGVGGDFMPDSIRGIASITKVFTTVSIMQLMERGKLHLDNPVSMYLKEFDTEMHRSITIKHLLTHTSGLIADPGYFTEPYPRYWGRGASDDMNWIEAILQGTLHSQPGEVWNYSSSGYTILGELVTRISGTMYYDYVNKHIIEPLALQDFKIPESKMDRGCSTSPGEREWAAKMVLNTDPARSSGGMVSTLQDLFRLGQMLMNKGSLDGVEILGRKTVEWMTTNQLDHVPAFSWGLNLNHIPTGSDFIF